MDFVRKQPVMATAIAAVLGLVLGLLIAWVIWPADVANVGPQHLRAQEQASYLITLAEVFERDRNAARVEQALVAWPEAPQAICALAQSSPENQVRLNSLAAALNEGAGCAAVPPATAEGGGTSLGTLAIFLVLLLVAAGIVWYVLSNRQSSEPRVSGAATYTDIPTAAPETTVEGDAAIAARPVARFRTTYTRGHDTYDDSFSIESEDGDFLGECGVGISESIGTASPKSVTAFEVWLFDKNDIRTVTKVIMSDHAFFDEGFKAKLAPKGEPVLARPHETIVLETATLIVNAEITEMEYGDGDPSESYFDMMTVELSAWAKEGDFGEPDVEGFISEKYDL